MLIGIFYLIGCGYTISFRIYSFEILISKFVLEGCDELLLKISREVCVIASALLIEN